MSKKKLPKVKYWFSFPQVKLFFAIAALTIITLVCAVIVKDTFWSSIFSNIFAGLVTGLVLFLLSGTRQIYMACLEERLHWLKGLDESILKYLPLHMQFIRKKLQDEERFNELYDILCVGNAVLEYFRWAPENKQLGFEPQQYCEKEYGVDIAQMTKHSEELHDKLRYETLPDSDREAWEWFKPFDQDLHTLHNAVRHDIESCEIRLASVKRSII